MTAATTTTTTTHGTKLNCARDDFGKLLIVKRIFYSRQPEEAFLDGNAFAVWCRRNPLRMPLISIAFG
jgi:hypothetical protein